MQSEIKVGQRFKFNMLSDNPSATAADVEFYFAYWVEAHELPETEVPTTLEFQRGIDGNVYLNGRRVSITLLK